MTVLFALDGADPTEVGSYAAADGRVLRYRVVRAVPERHRILYLHGVESHGGWFLAAAHALARLGCTTWLVDRRGSGMNRATRPGDAASADELLEDVRRFREHAELGSFVLAGLSWGGKLALASALDRPEGVRAVVLVTPGLVPRLDFTPLQKAGVVLSLAAGGRARFSLPIRSEMFTRTPRYLEYIEEDRLRIRRVTARFLLASRGLDRMLRARIEELEVPVLLFLAGHDRIIDNARTRALLDRLPQGSLRVRVYGHATHSIQFDDTEDLARDVAEFLEEVPC